MQTTISVIIISLSLCGAQWIDPYSMDTKHKDKLPNPPQKSPVNYDTFTKPECDSDIHLKRIVRIILNNAHLHNEVGYYEGYINIKLSSVEHQFLINFSQGAAKTDNTFSEVSHIFENAFEKPVNEKYEEIVLALEERLYRFFFNSASQSLAAAFLALLLTYKLLKAKFTVKSIFKFFLISAYIGDVVITYLNILREEEIASMVKIKTLGTTPPECDPEKMSWWDFIKTQFKSTFTENPCKAYYQATYQSYQYLIEPSKILTRQFRTLIVEPFGDIGEAFGKFGRSMFTSLPWGLNVVIFPIMLVTVCAMFFMVFLFITKPYFKVSLFHLFTVELGKSEQKQTLYVTNNDNKRKAVGYVPNRSKNRKQGREVGLNTNHRALIEEVSNDNSSSHGKKSPKKSKTDTCAPKTEKEESKS